MLAGGGMTGIAGPAKLASGPREPAGTTGPAHLGHNGKKAVSGEMERPFHNTAELNSLFWALLFWPPQPLQ